MVLTAANAIGKTALIANVVSNICCDFKNQWFDEEEFTWLDKHGKEQIRPAMDLPIYKDFPFPKRGRIATTGKNLEEVGAIQTELDAWLPKGKYTSSKKGKNYPSEYKIGEDWVIDLMSYDQDKSAFESATLGFMIFDEPPPIPIFNATIARMRTGGIIMVFMTPLDEGGLLLEMLEEKESVEVDGEEVGKVEILVGEVEEACKEHGIRGHLEHKHIAQMISFYDEDEVEARVKGMPIHLIGKVYTDFQKEEPFVVDNFPIPDHWPRILAIDPHDSIPFAMSWAAIDEFDTIWIYDEYPMDDLEKAKRVNFDYVDYNNIIRRKEGRDKVVKRIIDPYFGNKKSSMIKKDAKTVKQELEEFGLEFVDGSIDGIELGHMRVKEYFKYDKISEVSAINHPKLRILRKCRNHWRSIYNYKRIFCKSGEVKDAVKLEETFKHCCDNIRHIVMSKPEYSELILINPDTGVIEDDGIEDIDPMVA